MSNSSKGTGTRQTISGRGQLLLAGLLVVALGLTVISLYVMAAQPVTPAAGNGADRVTAIQHQEEPYPAGFEQLHATKYTQEQPYPPGFEQAHATQYTQEQPYSPGFEQSRGNPNSTIVR